jgi:2-polyprenyl-3-methyl-5-hydroxy-6-metoxy-1,4-benzoquinol methylase
MEINEFWYQYYRQIFASGVSYLDYSNETVQLQCFATAIDVTGSVHGKRCLDVGAGTGSFSRMLHALGADRVCAVDFIPQAIDELKKSASQVESKLAKAEDITMSTFGYPFDRVFVLEVLQYVDLEPTVHNLWSLLGSGGRLIGVMPNADNRIIADVVRRFEDNFRAVTVASLINSLRSLPDVSVVRVKGLAFGSDQSVAAYESTSWSAQLTNTWNFNRIAFVAIKKSSD